MSFFFLCQCFSTYEKNVFFAKRFQFPSNIFFKQTYLEIHFPQLPCLRKLALQAKDNNHQSIFPLESFLREREIKLVPK